jgi:hypothetical protein
MIAQGWGGAAGMAGNIEWQAAIVDAKHAWNMHAKASKNVTKDAKLAANTNATINAKMNTIQLQIQIQLQKQLRTWINYGLPLRLTTTAYSRSANRDHESETTRLT